MVQPDGPQVTARYGAVRMPLSYKVTETRTQIKGKGNESKVHPITGHESPELE